jgi:enoyl-CoA hydratase
MIRCEVNGAVAELVIFRPPTNALSIRDLHVLHDLVVSLDDDPVVSVAIVRSEGAGFSSGIDFKEFQTPDGRELLLDSGLACRSAFAALRACSIPIIAAVHGFCCGAGVALVASCDLIVAGEGTRFALPEESWSIAHLARLVPPMRLRRAALSCEAIPAEELVQYGAIHRLVPAEALVQEAREVADTLCDQPRSTLAACKKRLNLVDPFDADRMFWSEQAVVFESTVGTLGGPRHVSDDHDASSNNRAAPAVTVHRVKEN